MHRNELLEQIRMEVVAQVQQQVDLQIQEQIPISLRQQSTDNKTQLQDAKTSLTNSFVRIHFLQDTVLIVFVGRQGSEIRACESRTSMSLWLLF